MENLICLKCQHCYEVCRTGYLRHYCKYFKYWLLPNDKKEPQRTTECNQLGGENGIE